MNKVIKVAKILKTVEGSPNNTFYVLSTDNKVLIFSINVSLWSNPVIELRRCKGSFDFYCLYYRQALATRFMSFSRAFFVQELNEQQILEELL